MKSILVCGVLLLIFATAVHASSTSVETSSDRLGISETLGNVVQSFTSQELSELAGGTISTKQGKTDYAQYLRFGNLSLPYVTLKENEDGVVSDFLFVDDGTTTANAFFEYEIDFDDGLDSNIAGTVLEDLPEKSLNLFNEPYTFVTATTDGTKITLDLATGVSLALLTELEQRSFTVDGKTHLIKLDRVETSGKEASLSIDGSPLQESLAEGEIHALSDGVMVGVSKILVNSDGKNMAQLFVGGKIIRFTDSNYQDNSFEHSVEVNKKKINKGFVNIVATKSGTILSISKIKYRLASTREIFVPEDEGLKKYLEDQNSLLANWDITYHGLREATVNKIALTPASGNSEYKLSFVNTAGNTLSSIPFLTNRGGSLGLGDQADTLVIKEDTQIALNNYFVVTNTNTPTGVTYVVRYTQLDTVSSAVRFYDVAQNKEIGVSYVNGSGTTVGTGTLTVGTLSVAFNITTSSGNPLLVDLNADGTIGSSTVNIVAAGGAVLITTVPSGSTYAVTLETDASKFDENSTDEQIGLTFETRGTSGVGVQGTFTGITTRKDGTSTRGLSNYGVSLMYEDPGGDFAETVTLDYPTQQRFAEVTIDVGAAQTISSEVSDGEDSCTNEQQDGDETGVDCGGPCSPCGSIPANETTESCTDGTQNQDETGVDCGGAICPACIENKCPNACLYSSPDNIEVCLQAGERVESVYCSDAYKITLQKSNGLSCVYDYECKIGICEEGKCGKSASLGLVLINILIAFAAVILLYLIVDVAIRRE